MDEQTDAVRVEGGAADQFNWFLSHIVLTVI